MTDTPTFSAALFDPPLPNMFDSSERWWNAQRLPLMRSRGKKKHSDDGQREAQPRKQIFADLGLARVLGQARHVHDKAMLNTDPLIRTR